MSTDRNSGETIGAKQLRNRRRNRRWKVARAMKRFGAELANKPRAAAVRAWLKRWWIWAASRVGAEPQPPKEECWRIRDPRFWAAARRQAPAVEETGEARTTLSDRVRGALHRAMGR